jgi:hypothetical protein
MDTLSLWFALCGFGEGVGDCGMTRVVLCVTRFA